jgi:hypothetical protein
VLSEFGFQKRDEVANVPRNGHVAGHGKFRADNLRDAALLVVAARIGDDEVAGPRFYFLFHAIAVDSRKEEKTKTLIRRFSFMATRWFNQDVFTICH